jgi:transposase
MKTFLEICAEIDIGKREIAVTILAGAANSEPTAETRTFGTTTRELTECAEWLRTGGCSTVVIESTGSYWLPVWNVLHTGFALIIANPDHVKARRGEKTDAEDSRRLAERLRVGDVRGSFVPPDKVVVLRDLTRRRKRLLTAANSERNRVQKLLERANVKFGNVVSDVFGYRGRGFSLRFSNLSQLRRPASQNWQGDVCAIRSRRSPKLLRATDWINICGG